MEKEEARPDLMFHGTGTVSLLHGQPWRVHSSLLLSPCFFFFSFLFFSLLQKCLRWLTLVINFGSISIQLFPDGSAGKESTCNAGDTRDTGSIPGSGRSPGVENGNPLQYSCLGNSMDRGAQQATVHGVTKSQTQLK